MKMFPAITALLGDSVGPLSKENDIIPLLLMLLVGVVLGMLLVFSVMMVHALRKERLATRRLPRHSEFLRGERRSPASLFSAPTRWLAIRSGNPHLVQAALGLGTGCGHVRQQRI